MRKAARVVLIKDDRLLVMHRNKFGTEFYTLPGGGIEPGETGEQAAVREIYEETMITFNHPRLVMIEDAGTMYGQQFIYLGEYISGEPAIQPGSEEDLINRLGKNIHTPMWLPMAILPSVEFVSLQLKNHILHFSEYGWPEDPITFSTR